VTTGAARWSPLPDVTNEPAWLHGRTVFTTVRTQGGAPLLWASHVARLSASCDALRLPDPTPTAGEVLRCLQPLPEGRLRLTVGASGAWFSHAPLARVSHAAVRVHVTDVQVHPQFARHKTGNHLPYALASAQAVDAGAFEGWLVDAAGNVVDGARSGLLLETRDGYVVPSGGLPSVTRAALLDELQLPVTERRVHVSELGRVRRAWIMGSGVGVLPVASLSWAGGARDLDVSWFPVTHPALIPPRRE